MSNSAYANWVLFFPIAITIFIATRIAAGWAVHNQRSLLGNAFHTCIKLMLCVSMIGICCRSSISSLIWFVLAGISIVVMAIKRREMQRSAFLLTLFHCAHQTDEVRAIANSFANENQGWLQRRCSQLIRALNRTRDWGQAIEMANLVRGVRHKLALRLFSQLGKPGLVRRDMIRGEVVDNLLDVLLGRMCLLVVSMWGLTIVVFIEVFIIPTFVRLFEEFDMQLPDLFVWLNENSMLVNALVAIAMMAATGISVIAVILYIFPNAITFGPQRLLFQSYFRSLSFDALAESCEGEANLVDGIRQVAVVHPVSAESSMLVKAANKIDAGMSLGTAFRRAWLVNRKEAAQLNMSLSQTSLSSIFRQLGSGRFDRCVNWYATLVQFLLIVFIFALATVVMLFATSVFAVLAGMIELTAEL